LTKFIYIGGYGHSGSTLLEYLLARSPAVLACGEIASCVREGPGKRKKCSCGKPADRCPVWSSLYSRGADSESWSHIAFARALTSSFNGRYAAILDSSKTAWGSLGAPLRLRRAFGNDFMLLHLTREPVAVCWSALKQKKRRHGAVHKKSFFEPLRCGWIVLGWSIANLSCEIFRKLYPRQYLHVRYEDLARSPEDTLDKLFADLLGTVRWRREISADNRHQLYGNKVRYREIGIHNVKEDLRWKKEMPPRYSRLAHSLSTALRLRYGYS
jgi:hypothetical protein